MILVDGLPSEEIKVMDRGLMYGDGVFRTLMLRSGKPQSWQRHYAKLWSDCQRLGIDCPSSDLLHHELRQLAENGQDCVAKIMITRGVGGRGYAIDSNLCSTRIVLSAPLPVYPSSYLERGVLVRVCDLRLSHQPRLAGIKHLNRLENVLARMEWQDSGIAEGLLLDQAGNVIGGTMSSLFMLRDGALYVPDLCDCGVSGVTRERVKAASDSLGMKWVEGKFKLADLFAADEVILGNSVIGVWQIAQCGERCWQPGKLVFQLRSLLNKEENQA